MEKDLNFNFEAETNIEILQDWFQTHLDEFEVSDDENNWYLPRESPKHINYWKSNWGQLLDNPDLKNPNSKVSKLFQLRFRVPYILFKHFLVPKCIEHNIFDIEMEGHTRCPIEIKILSCLRLIGRGMTFDDINELSLIPNSSIANMFYTFVENFASKMYNFCIRDPSLSSLQSRMDHYSALGLPGAMGSVDCTRVHWDKCPKDLRNFAIGKEKFPTLSFLVVCDHNRQIQYVSENAYLGALNDINVANVDPFMVSLRHGSFKSVEFYLILSDGTRLKCYGSYLISDNGFFTSSVLMDPPKNRFNEAHVLWAEWLESVRKDIECLFGILKIRFRILLQRMQQHSVRKIRNIFITCCILHNILNMYKETLSDPLYEIDPDVDEELFMAWDENLHPTWKDYLSSFSVPPIQGECIKKKKKISIFSDLVCFPIMEVNTDTSNKVNLQAFMYGSGRRINYLNFKSFL